MLKPIYKTDIAELWQGHVIEVARYLPEKSIHCLITSPPYWGLRSYGTEPQIWGGRPDCEHVWGKTLPRSHEIHHGSGAKDHDDSVRTSGNSGHFCQYQDCRAWRGELGLEPTPNLYIEHLVSCFDALRPALRDDATCWVNIGDSHCSNKGGNRNGLTSSTLPGANAEAKRSESIGTKSLRPASSTYGLAPGNVCLIPHRFAIAMQERGWILRSANIWAKGVSFCSTYSGSVMPDSVAGWRWERHRIRPKGSDSSHIQEGRPELNALRETNNDADRRAVMSCANPLKSNLIECPGCDKCNPNDGYILRKGSWRPTSAYEMLFQFANTGTYYGDGEGVREDTGESIRRGTGKPLGSTLGEGRNDRDRFCSDIATSGRNLRNVWTINPKPYPKAHFATFPPALVEPCIKSSTSDKGVCSKCGAPWARVLKRRRTYDHTTTKAGKSKDGPYSSQTGNGVGTHDVRHGVYTNNQTHGWRPTCPCQYEANAAAAFMASGITIDKRVKPVVLDPVPATVLDPFCGSGTTGKVAIQLERHFVGIDLQGDYCIEHAVPRLHKADTGIDEAEAIEGQLSLF